MDEEKYELEIDLCCFMSDEELAKNINANLLLDIPTAKEAILKDRVASLCGSGPSIEYTKNNLTGDIWACNGAYDWLQDQGIIADYFFCWDPGTEVLAYLKRPNKKTTFYLASTCDPLVFEMLEDFNVVMWHACTGGDYVIHNILARYNRDNNKKEFYVGGGSACMTRAPYLLTSLGYKEINLHGADSSLTDDGKSHVAEGISGSGIHKVWCLGREFLVPLWMGAQSQQFLPMINKLKDSKIIVHGDGLIPHIARMNGLHYDNVI